MDIKLIVVYIMTFMITFIGTLAYSVRIVGVRTGKIAITFSLFNVLVLFSRLANTVYMPLLTKQAEHQAVLGTGEKILGVFYWILLFGVVATILGMLAIPTFQRVFTIMVNRFSYDRSVPKVIMHGFTKSGVRQFANCMTIPKTETLKRFSLKELPIRVLLMNTMAVAILAVATIAPIYAGQLEPDYRATCLTLSGIINGLATIILYVFVDPQLSVKTDDVIEGKITESEFRRLVVGMVGSKVVGAVVALLLLVPAAKIIALIARMM